MTKRRMSVELQENLERIWDLGDRAVRSSRFALVASGDECFLMRGDFWGQDIDDLLSDLSGASHQLLARYEEFYEATPPQTRDLGFIKPHPGKPAHWRPTDPSLYKVSGVGFEELKKLILKNLRYSLTTLKVDVHGDVLDGPHFYEAWSCNSRKAFFEARGFHAGDFYWTNVNDEVIDLLSYINRTDEVASIRADTSWKEHFSLSNSLDYRVEIDSFIFKIYLRAESASIEDEFIAVKTLLNFFFGAVHDYDDREQSFVDFLSKHLDIEPELLSQGFEAEEWAELFLGDMERSLSGERKHWIRPDYIFIQIQTSEFDPSFGATIDGPLVTYTESIKNWAKTDFNNVAIEPYLARLRRQTESKRKNL